MNHQPDQPDPDRFDTSEIVDFFLEEDGADTTVRPCSPEVNRRFRIVSKDHPAPLAYPPEAAS